MARHVIGTLIALALFCRCHELVEAVRATLGSFGSDSSKTTKYGRDIPYNISFRFFWGAKKSDTWGSPY